MTSNNSNSIINNYFNFFMDSLDNKNLENKKRNKNTNIAMITQKLEFNKLCNSYIRNKYT